MGREGKGMDLVGAEKGDAENDQFNLYEIIKKLVKK